ncbi:MAG: hypothetical protein COY81_04465 [Candidatus Pacebacteria bacterium CG_4_10_14_0_8_um_filter_43_12]|nr:MAG: hypothetical protein COU66_00515 [Candidatus Pacebacteria bacterium CG10_big_fil_rev_8_21_14_0_10_44_11]PIY79139.1 MAG: hypothetical protein COY81_04465 [Candidatus Pacebacteria bacterium CG_4_10_14_0_8_um_filter_43_12]
MLSLFQKLIIGALLLLGGAMIALVVLFLRMSKSVQQLEETGQSQVSQPIGRPAVFNQATDSALTDIQASLAALLTRVETLEQPLTSKTTPNSAGSAQKTDSALRKQVLYLGSASTTNRDWTETGLELVIDTNDYPANTSVVYEAGLSIVNGEAWSRLKNKTTGAIINVSEVSHNGSTPTWKGSGSFKLHPGQNSYQVELRSTSGEVANLSGARVILSW